MLLIASLACLGAVAGLGVGRGGALSLRAVRVGGPTRPCSSALCAAPASEGPPSPPYLEAYGYTRDTENRLASQIAMGVSTFQATADATKDLVEKNSKESNGLLEKTINESIGLLEKTFNESKELQEKNAKEFKDLLEKDAKEINELQEEIIERANLTTFLNLITLALLAYMQPGLRSLFSIFLSMFKLE